MNKAIPASNKAVIKSLQLLHMDAWRYPNTDILRAAYLESIIRRGLTLRLPRK